MVFCHFIHIFFLKSILPNSFYLFYFLPLQMSSVLQTGGCHFRDCYKHTPISARSLHTAGVPIKMPSGAPLSLCSPTLQLLCPGTFFLIRHPDSLATQFPLRHQKLWSSDSPCGCSLKNFPKQKIL